MSVIWLSKVKWETVWNALHHIMIRQDFTVRTPSAGLSGSGTGARLHIDLPATAAAGGYSGPFAVTLADGKLSVTGGWLLRNGEMTEVAAATGIAPAAGYLCVYSAIKSEAWTKPEFRIVEKPAPDAYPVAKIEIDEKTKAVSVRQYPVAAAVIMLTRTCPQIKVE